MARELAADKRAVKTAKLEIVSKEIIINGTQKEFTRV